MQLSTQRELRVLGHVGLHEQRAALRVEPHREQLGDGQPGALAQRRRVVPGGDGVQVDHAVERVVRLLHGHPVTHRAQVVAEVEGIGGRLDAGEHPRAAGGVGHERHCVSPRVGPSVERPFSRRLQCSNLLTHERYGGTHRARLRRVRQAAESQERPRRETARHRRRRLHRQRRHPAAARRRPRGRRARRPQHRVRRARRPRTPRSSRPRIQDAATVLTPDAGFDAVLHFAGLIAAGESMTKPELYWDNNVTRLAGPARRDARRRGAAAGVLLHRRRLRQPDRAAHHRAAPTKAPTNTYGATKLAFDMALTSEAFAHGLAAVSLRYFNVAGAYLRPDGTAIGERHDPETHLIPIALQVAAGKREKLQLFGDDYPTADGTCVRDYIHVEDLARAHLLALDAAARRRAQDLQPGQRQRLLQPPGRRGRPRGHRAPSCPVEIAPAPRRRPGDPGRLVAAGPRRTRLGAAEGDAAGHDRRRLGVLPHPRRMI